MKKILIPTDFSEDAYNALLYSLPFAKEWNATILLIHVYPPPSGPDVAWVYVESEREAWEKGAKSQLEKLVSDIAEKEPNVGCEYVIRQGPLVNEVVELTKEQEIDLIIMGTQGAKGLEKFLVGTSTADVVSHVKCPVIVVPEDYVNKGLKKIVFASDYQEEDIAVIKDLASMAAHFNADITVIHIAPDVGDYEDQKFKWFQDMVKQQVPYQNIFFELVKHYDIQEGLEDFIKFHSIDLLCMSMKKRNLLERIFQKSETKEMAYHSLIPLLAYHAGDLARIP